MAAVRISEGSEVLFGVSGGIATLTLNRPDHYNAMSNALMAGVGTAIDRVAQDETIRVVILTGAGKGFCSGADLSPGANLPQKEEARDEPLHPMRDIFNPTMEALRNCPVPTIARVNGAAAGGGFGLALACDITIAARSAFFVATFSPRLGIVPDLGSTWSIPRTVGRARALGISLLGERIPAQQAADWGLIWRTVDDDQLDEEVGRTADILQRSSPDAVIRTRQSIDAAVDLTFVDQLDLERAHQDVLIPRHMKEGANAFREKRDPTFGPERYNPRDG